LELIFGAKKIAFKGREIKAAINTPIITKAIKLCLPPCLLIIVYIPTIPMKALKKARSPKQIAQSHVTIPAIANWMKTEKEARRVIYWLVEDMMIGTMLYLRKSGPRTIPPAIPVIPQRMEASMQARAILIISLLWWNLISFSSQL